MMRRIIAAVTTASQQRHRRAEGSTTLAATEEHDASKPLLHVSIPAEQGPSSYGAIDGRTITSSPEHIRRHSLSLDRVPEEQEDNAEEEDEEDVEWELEERGLYKGSYKRKVALYTLVPISCFLLLILLALLPLLVWPIQNSRPPSHPQYFPFPLPELLVSTALWSLTHLIRLPIYTGFSLSLKTYSPIWLTILFNLAYAFVYNLLRIAGLPVLRVRHDMDYPKPTWRDLSFHRVWFFALGWATIEVIVGIVQDYAQIALYKNVMIPDDKLGAIEAEPNAVDLGHHHGSSSSEILILSPRTEVPQSPPVLSRNDSRGSAGPQLSIGSSVSEAEVLEAEVDRDLERLINLKEREDLEEIYGLPIIKIPVFVLALQRIDSILITIGITLTLSACYLRSNISLSTSVLISPPGSTNTPIIVAFPLTVLLNTSLMILYTPLVLPRVGIHAAAYIAFLVGLGTFFAGLGLWGALS
ncbi:hypothetical protein K474DRAFT_1675169 [Panus rudis PR-1116 ss-1]|nr:hypothetical protein K474DRAFT_1675169 [Panus rudis PR-1116 ss-1]